MGVNDMGSTPLATHLASLQTQLVDGLGDLTPYFLGVIGAGIAVGLVILGARRGWALLKGFSK